MSLFHRARLRLFAFLLAFAALVPASAGAHEYKAGQITIGHPWSRATPAGAKVAAGYLTLKNEGSEPDRLVGASAAIAGKGEIHEMKVDAAGVMTMRPVEGGVALPPGAEVALEPGGFHLMFMDLKAPAVQGQKFKGTLTFEKAGTVEVEYAVEGVGGTPHSAMKHGG